ncbi:chemotaxis protein CheA [Geobacter sp. AOG1]|uniref:chemotaxis protein CheA n=1 Tax=Geobacter sp. AOG1 TaxID=1566346 RepID=UPI001CC6A634|nr:chemotaxis protein CheA [Geobacter sp. AOG1]GFE56677.1 chemotaxis protein CheA [Geobacter sp. AOG1]
MIEQLRQAFREEADELLTDLELSLLELERNPTDEELVDRIFRAMHTIKGSSAMFGFDRITSFSHEVESVLEMLRDGRTAVTKELIVLTLAARDQIKEMLKSATGGGEAEALRAREIVAAFRILADGAAPLAAAADSGTDSPENAESGEEITFIIRFRPARDTFMRGLNPVQCLNELRELGACHVTLHTDQVPPLAELDPEICYLSWDVVLTTTRGLDAIYDIFMFAGEECVEIEVSHPGSTTVAETSQKAGVLPSEGRREGISPEPADSRDIPAARGISSIRVTADKLDRLINLVGELVTVQARLSRTALARDDDELITLAEEVERLTAGLRDSALTIRMIPIGGTFSKFKRMVHDLSTELGKDVELVTTGADTELDKTVIEKLNDPLVHLIRNSIDHGIESPDVRLAAGKPARGTIHLSAVHSGDSVLVTIRDDGAGIDRDAVRARGIAKGLIPAGAELSDKEAFSLLFAPGFSTAETVTSISGRGVGMDVVKRGVDLLRGTISVASAPGEGTAVTIRIPLTLAIIESLLVKIGADCFVIPLSQVEECIELTRTDVTRAHGHHLADVRGRIIPYVPLREHFGIAGERPEIEQIVIADIEGKRVGLVVDYVIGEHQTVIKSIGKMFREVRGVSGATILGDGSVALILDVQQLVADEERLEH